MARNVNEYPLNRMVDILFQTYRRYVFIEPPVQGRILMIGGKVDTLISFWQKGLQAFRITRYPSVPYDVVARAPYYPIRLNSIRLVLFYLGYIATATGWTNMTNVMDSLSLVEPGGFWAGQDIVFNAAVLMSENWEKLPIYFEGMAVWQKPYPGMFRQFTDEPMLKKAA